MAATARMPASSRPQPLEQFKPRQAAKQHMQCPTSPKEPFDADLLSRKLESYRQELKLERARKGLADKKSTPRDEYNVSLLMGPEKKPHSIPFSKEKNNTSTVSDPVNNGSGVQRSKSLNIAETLNVPEQSEQKRSLIHRRSKHQEPKDDSSSVPYVPRFAAKQFKSTTTPAKKNKQKSEMKSTPVKEKRKSGTKSTSVKKPASPKHKLDWSEPVSKATVAQAPSTESPPDMAVRRAAFSSIQNNATNHRQRPLSTALENLRICEPEQNPYILPTSPRQAQHIQDQEVPTAIAQFQQRPHLRQDRHDWSQASQCGDSARVSLHLHRKDVAGENAEIAGLRPGHAARNKGRQKSHGDTPDGLVNEAVRLIREEKKKGGIFGVFRRH